MQSWIPPHGKNLKIKNTFENFGIHELSQAWKELSNGQIIFMFTNNQLKITILLRIRTKTKTKTKKYKL
jgi:hypothetical protein